MANVYYTHYYLSACTKYSDVPFTVNLEKRHPDTDSPPDPIRISGGKRPIILSYKNQGDYKIFPIQGSEAKLTLLSDDVFSGLEAIDEREWRVSITLNNVLHWRGFVLPDDGQEPFATKPFPISIRATDVLGTFKDLPYTQPWEIRDKGYITKMQLLVKLLNRTELGLDIIIADNTFESLMTRTGSTQNCPWPQTLYSNTRYFDPEGRPYSCYEILRSILEEKSCTIKQVEGIWYIINQEENNRGLTAIPYRRYTSEGVYVSSGTITHSQQLGGNGKQAVIAGSNKTMRTAKAHLSNIAYYQYGYAASTVLNGDFNDWPLPLLFPVGWTQKGGVRASQYERMVNGIPTGDYGVRLLNANNKESRMYMYNQDGVQIKANESVTISFDVFIELNGEDPGFINSRRSKMWVILTTSDAYAWDGTQWLKYATYPNQTKIEWGKGEWAISNDDFGYGKASEKKTVTINIPARDVDYKLTIGLGNVYRNDITGEPNNLMITAYDNVEIRPSVVDEVLKPPLGRYVQHTQDKPLSYTPEPIVILNGDDTNEQRTSWIRVMQGGIFFDGNFASKWYRRGEVLPTPLLSVIAGNAMQLHSRPYKIFEVDVERSEITPYTRVDLDLFDSHFVFLSGDFDLLNESASLVLAEQISGVAPVTELVAEDYGSLKNKNQGLSIGQIGGVTIGGNGSNGNNGGSGTGGKPTNRFVEYFMVDTLDKVVARVTTNMVDSFDIYSKYDNLMLRVREIDDAPDFADIAYDMEEGTGLTYRELNLHFRRADGTALDDVYFSDTGIVGADPGQTKPASGEPVRAEITYYGGIDGVEPWAGPTMVTFEVFKNGALYERFQQTYDTPPAAGSLAQINFVPIKGENWEVNAVAEPVAAIGSLTVTNNLGSNQIQLSSYDYETEGYPLRFNLATIPTGTNDLTYLIDDHGSFGAQFNNNTSGYVRVFRNDFHHIDINPGGSFGITVDENEVVDWRFETMNTPLVMNITSNEANLAEITVSDNTTNEIYEVYTVPQGDSTITVVPPNNTGYYKISVKQVPGGACFSKLDSNNVNSTFGAGGKRDTLVLKNVTTPHTMIIARYQQTIQYENDGGKSVTVNLVEPLVGSLLSVNGSNTNPIPFTFYTFTDTGDINVNPRNNGATDFTVYVNGSTYLIPAGNTSTNIPVPKGQTVIFNTLP